MPFKLVYYSEAHEWWLWKTEVSIQDADKCWYVENVWTNSEWLVKKPIARVILRRIKLTAPGRMSDTARMPVFARLLSPLGTRRVSVSPAHSRHDSVPCPLPASHQHQLTELWLNFPAQASTFLTQSTLFKPNLHFILQSCHLTQALQDRF